MSQPTPLPPRFELERLCWAFQGLAEVCNPDYVLDGKERSHLGTLVEILAERLAHVHHAITAERAALLAELEQVRAGRTTPPAAEGGTHVSPD